LVNQTSCISTVKSIQTQDSSLDDIPYNFLIGSDGRIYEGRGIEYQGQHTNNLDATEYNSIGICIAFIGNYQSISPDLTQINLLRGLIDFNKRKGLIADDYIIVLQDDLKYFVTRATKLNAAIKTLDNFRPRKYLLNLKQISSVSHTIPVYKIYRREEWNAQRRKNQPSIFETRPMNWVLIGHTVSTLCSSLVIFIFNNLNLI